jgi:adenylate cyclase
VTPIIFVTGVGESSGVPKAFEAGCNDFISKPMNAVVLRARLRGHLEKMDYFHQLEATRRMLNRYLSPRTLKVVEAASEAGLPDPPAERNLTVLFTDIREFTASSEGMDPNRLFSLVSSLLAEQVDCIHEFGGYVDKFGGDGVMAVFDAPDMVVQSCLCALSILERARIKHSSETDRIWQFGIGIHTGKAVIGNIGSLEHMDYSVIGNVVNLAARLCGHAVANAAVVSQSVYAAAAEDPRLYFHTERKVPIRGVKEPVTVYTLTQPGESNSA